MKNKLGIIAIFLLGLQGVLILLSWIASAAFPEWHVSSLLSEEGIRWFFRTFTGNLETDILMWILLFLMAYGALKRSGLLGLVRQLCFGGGKISMLSYRQRMGLRTVFFELFIFIVVSLLLTMFPQAILLSVTGELFPSSFSDSVLPSISFAFILIAFSYGFIAGAFRNLNDAYAALSVGLLPFVRFFPIYLLIVELINSVLYIFQF